MHFGYNNPCREYKMGGARLMMTESKKDNGVVIHSALKPSLIMYMKMTLQATSPCKTRSHIEH